MKKVLLSITLVLSMLVTACGNKNPFVGTWRGTWDITNIMNASFESNEWQQYGSFKNLAFDIMYTFDEESVEIETDKKSLETLTDKIQEQMLHIFDAYIEDYAVKNGYSADDLYEEMGTTREETVKVLVDEMDLDSIIEAISEELKAECGYSYDEEARVVKLETGGELEYKFDGKDLIFSFEMDGRELKIECKKVK